MSASPQAKFQAARNREVTTFTRAGTHARTPPHARQGITPDQGLETDWYFEENYAVDPLQVRGYSTRRVLEKQPWTSMVVRCGGASIFASGPMRSRSYSEWQQAYTRDRVLPGLRHELDALT